MALLFPCFEAFLIACSFCSDYKPRFDTAGIRKCTGEGYGSILHIGGAREGSATFRVCIRGVVAALQRLGRRVVLWLPQLGVHGDQRLGSLGLEDGLRSTTHNDSFSSAPRSGSC